MMILAEELLRATLGKSAHPQDLEKTSSDKAYQHKHLC
jgi:hypothetical protein